MEPSWLDRHSPTTDAPTRSKVDLIKTKNPVGYSPTRSLFHRGFCNDFRGLNPACGVSSKCSPPELRSYKQNQGRGYLFRTLPEVNPKFSIPQKFSGTKDVGACWLVVGRRGLHSHGLGGQEIFRGEVEKTDFGVRWRLLIVNYYSMLSNNVRLPR